MEDVLHGVALGGAALAGSALDRKYKFSNDIKAGLTLLRTKLGYGRQGAREGPG